MKLKSSVQITLIIVAAIIILTLITIFTIKSFIPSSGDDIQVSGQATIEVTPDLITLFYNVETQGETSKEAEDLNTNIVNELRDQVALLGIESELETQNFNIYPEYNWNSGKQELIGYKATHSLKIELSTEQINLIGDLIDAGTNAGTGISYINFELSDELEQEYKAEAIKLAASDARIKAEAIAEGFNKKVGKLKSVSLNDFNYYPIRAYDFAEAGGNMEIAREAATSITPSGQDVTAYVNAVYKLK